MNSCKASDDCSQSDYMDDLTSKASKEQQAISVDEVSSSTLQEHIQSVLNNVNQELLEEAQTDDTHSTADDEDSDGKKCQFL